jgi:hypothetical protein
MFKVRRFWILDFGLKTKWRQIRNPRSAIQNDPLVFAGEIPHWTCQFRSGVPLGQDNDFYFFGFAWD